jgi:16S rRNA (cytosine1407-C5)-methyltransferase
MQIEDNLPKQFLDKLSLFVPKDKLPLVLQSFSIHKPLTLRVNTVTSNKTELLSEFKEENILLKPISWYQDAFSTTTLSKTLTSLLSYQDGKFYIQGLSSMIPPLVLNPQENDVVLDMASAPGSKTTQIACIMQNKGEIVANDMSRTRLFKLRANLKQQKITNVYITNMPGERMWRKYPEYFDKVLVDAPCSMEGRFTTNDPDSYKEWSLKKVKELSHRQKYLLRSALTATKVGGVVVYSTCTLSPEENEGVIDWLLEKEGDSIQIEKIDIPHLNLSPGIREWGKNTYNPEVTKTARIYPDKDFEGFFIVKIRKIKTTLRPELFSKR